MIFKYSFRSLENYLQDPTRSRRWQDATQESLTLLLTSDNLGHISYTIGILLFHFAIGSLDLQDKEPFVHFSRI